MDKAEILREFSADPDRHYRVGLFGELGFERRACARCGRFFWTQDPGRTMCPDDGEDTYSFIGDPPTAKRLDYTGAWSAVEGFFEGNGHRSVGRYPVVCRWRDDLYFTIASIVDFQRVMGSKVVFEFPANPLVVPQTCLRFKDLENVGVTGRHFSSFCMIGQHSVPDGDGGYWKDECIRLDHALLTGRFGIPSEEVVFVEDVWAGGGSFGPSLEYFVRGLELGNAVFTEFQGELGRHTVLDQRVIDMGAGLERLAWITAGTPTAYDCCFGPINGELAGATGVDPDAGVLRRYYTEIARGIDRIGDLNGVRRAAVRNAGVTDSQLERMIAPLEASYLIADHLRTLVFAISDGALPSNVGGGYNLRVMVRRMSAAASRLGLGLDVDRLVDLHVDYLRATYPELDEKRGDVKEILGIELGRYEESRIHMREKAGRMRSRGEPTAAELVTLYESDGITPEYLREEGVISEVPSEFYSRLAELHQSAGRKAAARLPLDGLPETEAMFHGSDPHEFEARVLRVVGDSVILDRTSFYARGGGQEPDRGRIGGFDVVDVERHAGVIVHKLEGGAPAEGDAVRCMVDSGRRAAITRNHTSTHILNASARGVLGSWVWQHSAFKDADHARLDITHHSPLTGAEVKRIEEAANGMVRDDLEVGISHHDRGEAERRYGFSIYQGGVVPVKSVRIVSIGGRDVEACGGTHVARTGEIGAIRITRTKRIQDGVVRLEFVSGDGAAEYDRRREAEAARDAERAGERERLLKGRGEERARAQRLIPVLVEKVLSGGLDESDPVRAAGKACIADGPGLGEYFCQNFGKKLVARDAAAAFCGIYESGGAVRIVVHAGAGSGVDAGAVAGEVSSILGGAGGGGAALAQGGGKDASRRAEAAARAAEMMGVA